MSATKLRKALTTIAQINSAVSGRILLSPVEQGTQLPYIAYELENDDPVRDLQGVSNLMRQEWAINIVATRFVTGEQIKDELIKALSGYNIEFYCSFQSLDYFYEPEIEQHKFTVNMLITYNI